MFNSPRIFLLFTLALVVILAIKLMPKKSTSAGTIIILNGPSSVGKSSIIKAFQAQSNQLWLGMGLDNLFVGVIPQKYMSENTPETHQLMQGIQSVDEQGNKIFTLQLGPDGEKVRNGMHRAIAAYTRAGNNVIVDYINYDASWLEDLKKSLAGLQVIYVGVKAPLEVIEQREKQRGTSPEGHARSHYFTVHEGFTYDLVIEGDKVAPDEGAEKIVEFLEQT